MLFRSLNDIDQLNLIFLPLMKSSTGKSQRAIDAVEAAKKIRDERQREFLIGSLIGITDKFIDEEYVTKLMEVLRMTRVMREAFNEGVAEGEIKGEIIGMLKKSRQVILDYLDAKYGFESIELQEKVKDLASLDLLDKVLKRMFNADSLDKASSIIEEAIKAQEKINKIQ